MMNNNGNKSDTDNSNTNIYIHEKYQLQQPVSKLIQYYISVA